MIVKKKSEDTERKRTYTKRVLELLYPEEHASSVSSVDERGGGSDAATESRSELTSKGETGISTLEVTEKVQLTQKKMYGVSSPPEDHQLFAGQGDLEDLAADVQHSSSEDEEPFDGDLSSTRRRRRRHKRRKTSEDQPTTSAEEAQRDSTVTQSKSAATAEATEPMSKNRKRKMKKKSKQAERKHAAPSSEFVYKDIHETRIENSCLDAL